jgi:oxygen-dependent protoporphyrinogen oxidase
MIEELDVAVVGGGISGLTAARTLSGQGLRVRLFEREPVCGGVIRTDRVGDFVIDAGPDTLLAHKPAAIALARELGLSDSLVSPLPRRTTYLVRRNSLRALPDTSALGLPINWHTLVTANAFTWHGKVRMAAEALLPPRPPSGGDESISSFVRRRFGKEAVKYVAEPLLAGIHRGDAARLSLRALFPVLAEAERRYGSVARAWRNMPSRGAGGSMSLRHGLGQLVAAMHADLPDGVAVTGTEVTGIDRAGSAIRLRLRDGADVSARAVVLATPAHVTSPLTAGLDPQLADLCRGIRYVSTVNVALGYSREAVGHALHGWGFVVPADQRRHVGAVSWVSSKWPDRAPEGSVLMRASLAQAGDGGLMEMSDTIAIDRAHDDLRKLLQIHDAPTFARVYRLANAMPQLEVGHLDRIAAIDRRLAMLPGVFVTASGFRSVGLPACIIDARSVAESVAAHLTRSRHGASPDLSATPSYSPDSRSQG